MTLWPTAQGYERFRLPLHLQVSQVSSRAREAVTSAGGSVTTVYYNKLGKHLGCHLPPSSLHPAANVMPTIRSCCSLTLCFELPCLDGNAIFTILYVVLQASVRC